MNDPAIASQQEFSRVTALGVPESTRSGLTERRLGDFLHSGLCVFAQVRVLARRTAMLWLLALACDRTHESPLAGAHRVAADPRSATTTSGGARASTSAGGSSGDARPGDFGGTLAAGGIGVGTAGSSQHP